MDEEHSKAIKEGIRARTEKRFAEGLQVAPFYIDPYYKILLDKCIHRNTVERMDSLIIIDGKPGSYKSTLAQQSGDYILIKQGKRLGTSNLCFNVKQFIDMLYKSPPGSVIIFDEGFAGFTKKHMQQQQALAVALEEIFSQIRSRGLYIFICCLRVSRLPFFVVNDRAFAVIHTEKVNESNGWGQCWFDNLRISLMYKNNDKYGTYYYPNFEFQLANFRPLDAHGYQELKEKEITENKDITIRSEKLIEYFKPYNREVKLNGNPTYPGKCAVSIVSPGDNRTDAIQAIPTVEGTETAEEPTPTGPEQPTT